ncbi:hypothetical protein Avbf_01052, partial [Armadillidium vulgare]
MGTIIHSTPTSRLYVLLNPLTPSNSLKRSPQHIFVEVRVPGSGLRTLVHVLLIGHSWISYLEDNYNPSVHNPSNHEFMFKRIMFSKFEDIPIALERELRPNTTHIL